MNFKGSFKGLVKVLKSKQIKDFQSLTANLKKVFPAAPEPYDLCYYDGQDFVSIADQDDFQSIPENFAKIKVIIKSEDYDEFRDISRMDETLNRSVRTDRSDIRPEKVDNIKLPSKGQPLNPAQSGDTPVYKTEQPQKTPEPKKEEPAQTSKRETNEERIFSKKSQTTPKVVNEADQPERDSPPSQIKKMTKTPQPLEAVAQPESAAIKIQTKEKKQKPSLPVPANKTPFTHNVICNKCKSKSIVGIRWKCKTCYDYDLCEACYSTKFHQNDPKTKDHEFYEIKNDQFWKKINFREAIRKLFNPEYVEPENQDMTVEDWIKEEDIINNTPKFVKEVWEAAGPIIERISADFQKESRQVAVKSSKK